jgi:hypothetical protein
MSGNNKGVLLRAEFRFDFSGRVVRTSLSRGTLALLKHRSLLFFDSS